MTLQPAYGRDYTSKAAVLADFEKNMDFLQASPGRYQGKPVNKSQLIELKIRQVTIRYAADRKACVVEVQP